VVGIMTVAFMWVVTKRGAYIPGAKLPANLLPANRDGCDPNPVFRLD